MTNRVALVLFCALPVACSNSTMVSQPDLSVYRGATTLTRALLLLDATSGAQP